MKYPSLKGQGMISIDLETCDPDLKTKGPGTFRGGFICGVAIGTQAGYREYYPITHEIGPNEPKEKVFKWLKKELADPHQPKCGANLIYDIGYLDAAGVEVKGLLCDIQIAEPLLKENRFNYSLEALAQDYLDEGKVEDQLESWIIGKFGKTVKSNWKSYIWRAPSDLVRPYAIGDIDLPERVFAIQKPLLEKEGLWNLFVMESKLIPMLVAMRRKGVKVDIKRAQAMHDKMTKQQDAIQKEITRVAGAEVDVWAGASIAKVFDAMGLEYPLTAKTKKPSFTKDFLEQHTHPVTGMIKEVRRLDKMRGTFLEGCILEGRHTGNRIHCQFNQLKGEDGGAVSGRFSSSNPNLQFIPVRTDEGKLIRSMFIPDGALWWKLDYSQIEYRLMVHDAAQMGLRGAQTVVDQYLKDASTDFHKVVAAMTGLDRNAAKTVNFGIAYGEGVDKLASSLGLSREAGLELLKEYHRRAPFMRPLSEAATNLAKRTGVVETLLGRKRRFDAWQKKNWKTGETLTLGHRFPGAQRAFTHKALNARIQGSAADIMKKAMVDVWESGVCDIIGVPQLTVHDELDGSMDDTKAHKKAFKEIQNIMERTVKLLVPLKVDGGFGANWGSIKEAA